MTLASYCPHYPTGLFLTYTGRIESYCCRILSYPTVFVYTPGKSVLPRQLCCSLSPFLPQSFFALRCYKVLPKHWNLVGVLCFVVALVRWVGSIILAVNASKQSNLEEGRAKWSRLSTSILIVGACIDIIIAASMMYWLVQQRKRVFAR